MMNEKKRTPAKEKEAEWIRNTMGYLVFSQDCVVLGDRYNVDFHIERTKGKTHLLHITGKERQLTLFLDDLYGRTRDVPVKWITIPYKGAFRKWRFKQQLKKMR